MHFLTPFAFLADDDDLGPLSQLDFSPQGMLAVGSGWRVLFWDFSDEKIPEESFAFCGSRYLPSFAWSRSGKQIAVSQDRGVTLYELATDTVVQNHPHQGAMHLATWSVDDTRIISCSVAGECHLWLPETNEVLVRRQFSVAPHLLLWLADGRLVVNPFIAGEAGRVPVFHWQVQIWDESFERVSNLLDDQERRRDDYTCAAVAPGSGLLALGTQEGWVQLWRLTGERSVRIHHLPFHARTVSGLAWSPDGRYLASGAADGHVLIWSRQGEPCFHLCCRHGGNRGVRDVAWWRDVLAVADDGGQVALYRIPPVHSCAPTHPVQRFHLLR